MHNSELDNKIICYLGGAMTPDEQRDFEQQALSDASLGKRLALAREMWHSADADRRRQVIESRREEVWQSIAESTTRQHTLRLYVRTAMRIAAIVIPLIVLSIVGYGLMWQRPEKITYTAQADRLTVILPDSSEVTLNSNSQLTYWQDGDQRCAELSGMALFSVHRNEALPFVVSVSDARVEVLGTKFTVENIDNRDRVRVDVEEGLVAFSVGAEQKHLGVNDYATWRNGAMYTGHHTSCQSSWTREVIEFKNALLAGVAYELMSYYPEIKGIRGDLTADTTRVTTSFSHQQLQEVIEELNIHYNEKIAMDNGFLTISD